MTKKDLRMYAMYGLSVLMNKSFSKYRESELTDEKAHRLWLLYNEMWDELYDEEMKETEENGLKSL